MFGLNLSYKYLYFTRPTGPPHPVPAGLERHWLDTKDGRIEILSTPHSPGTPLASVSSSSGKEARVRPPVVFCHGGMGGAWVWTEYLEHLAKLGIPAYAVSLRGHGDSWYPNFFKMVFATPRSSLEADLVAAVKWVEAREGRPVVLAGHSSGGGLSQAVLAQGKVHAAGLALLGAVPAYGSLGVYINWWLQDPWFTFRCFFLHFFHSNSPLSHPVLVRNAFFGREFPMSSVPPFMARLNRYESYLWPFSMMPPFARAPQILASLDKNPSASKPKVLVMAGAEDILMTPKVTRASAKFYADAGADVRMELVDGAGHHLQNDVQWADGAERFVAWYQSL